MADFLASGPGVTLKARSDADQSADYQQAVSYVNVNVTVRDVNNAPVAGENFTIDVYLDESIPTFTTFTGVTNASGIASVVPSLTGCPPGAGTYDNYDSSVPAEHWKMVGAMGVVVVTLPNASPLAPEVKIYERLYFKVCSEQYLGRY